MEEPVPVVQDFPVTDSMTTGRESSTMARDRAVKQLGLDRYKNPDGPESSSMSDANTVKGFD